MRVTITYDVVKHGPHHKTLPCPDCGKKVKRQRTFEQTENPHNRNSSGEQKSRREILQDLAAEARVWQQEPERCAPCSLAYKARRSIKVDSDVLVLSSDRPKFPGILFATVKDVRGSDDYRIATNAVHRVIDAGNADLGDTDLVVVVEDETNGRRVFDMIPTLNGLTFSAALQNPDQG